MIGGVALFVISGVSAAGKSMVARLDKPRDPAITGEPVP